ncbi:MAG: hypothetical protein U0228_32090 [Myxococcaceae bacterium]
MKVKTSRPANAAKSTSKASAKSSAKSAAAKPKKQAEAASTSKAWGPKSTASGNVEKKRTQLTALATDAALKVISEQPKDPSTHPLLEKFGEALGLGLGVVVTEALALVPSWNAKLKDSSGKPLQHVEGADRIGNHDLRKRHQEVVGPQIAELVKKLPAGAVHDLLDGLAKGATAAPGTSYRLESKLADAFD